jgi:hypothetical protein
LTPTELAQAIALLNSGYTAHEAVHEVIPVDDPRHPETPPISS